MLAQFTRQDFARAHDNSLLNPAGNFTKSQTNTGQGDYGRGLPECVHKGVSECATHMNAERILDVCGLEQPAPLLRALAALDDLASGEYLHLLSHRDPVLLYPLLAQQGFAFERLVVREGAVEVLIWHVDDAMAERAARNLPR
jgi:uncharacterized protein (DUF2249 family)